MMKKKLCRSHAFTRTNSWLQRFTRSKAERPIRSASTREESAIRDSATTTDHKAIRKWAEERDGRPATVRATEEDGHAGILRIEESELAFLHQDRTSDGKLSRFHKFVRRSAE
jgi:hypothetical protein